MDNFALFNLFHFTIVVGKSGASFHSTPTELELSGEPIPLLLGRRCMFMFHVGQEAWPGPDRVRENLGSMNPN